MNVKYTCFLDEYKDHVNPHVRSNYLDPDDPRKLGGRSTGVQGQVGSTNGLERRGGIWQEQWRALRAKNSVDDQNNFLMMLEGEMKHHCAHILICGRSEYDTLFCRRATSYIHGLSDELLWDTFCTGTLLHGPGGGCRRP